MKSMKLSENFSLDEMIFSATARAHNIANAPTVDEIARLRALCANVLEPVRAHFKRPVKINSGFRSLALNRAIGSKDSSQHRLGEAADFEVPGVSNADVARWIERNLNFDQLILENHRKGDSASGWVHCSYREGRLRNQVLTMTIGSHGAIYTTGLAA